VQQQTQTNRNGEGEMTFDEWLKDGYDRGYCSPPVCVLHDGIPTTATEDEDMFEDMDVCFHGISLYDDLQTKNGCEANSPPAVWRANNLGWRK
jgi:hypothetical protein